MLIRSLALSVALALLQAASAHGASDESNYDRSGLYFGGSWNGAIQYMPSSLDSSNSWGFSGVLGYRFHPRVSVEADFEWVYGFKYGGSLDGIVQENYVGTANAKAYLLTRRLQPYVLVGPGMMFAKPHGAPDSSTETGFALRMGGGIDVYATESWVFSVKGSYVKPFQDVEDLDYVSTGLGVMYRW